MYNRVHKICWVCLSYSECRRRKIHFARAILGVSDDKVCRRLQKSFTLNCTISIRGIYCMFFPITSVNFVEQLFYITIPGYCSCHGKYLIQMKVGKMLLDYY